MSQLSSLPDLACSPSGNPTNRDFSTTTGVKWGRGIARMRIRSVSSRTKVVLAFAPVALVFVSCTSACPFPVAYFYEVTALRGRVVGTTFRGPCPQVEAILPQEAHQIGGSTNIGGPASPGAMGRLSEQLRQTTTEISTLGLSQRAITHFVLTTLIYSTSKSRIYPAQPIRSDFSTFGRYCRYCAFADGSAQHAGMAEPRVANFCFSGL